MIWYWEKNQNHIKFIVNSKISNAATIKDHVKYVNGEKIQREYLIIGSGYDIETSVIETEKYTASFCYHWQFSLDEYTIGGRTLDSMKEFFEYLLSTIKNDQYLLCLDANLGYEFQFNKRHWFDLGMSNLFAKEKRNPLKIDVGNKIEFREVLGLFGNNLAQIAENYCTIKKLKGDLDFSKVRLPHTPLTNKEKGYCENDVQILSQLGQYIFKNFFGKNPSLPMTKTGIIRAKVKRKLGTRLKFEKERVQANLPDETTYNIMRRYLFKGGICGTNAMKMGYVLNNVVCADYTSDYPACMNHYRFPDGRLEEIDPMEFMEHPNIPYIAIITFRKLRSKTSHSLLSTHKALDFKFDANRFTVDNNRIYKADEITFIVNDVEFKSICQAYEFDIETTEILRAWRMERYRKLPRHLLEVLNEEYLTKQELKSKGLDDTLEYKDSKAVVNGTFGMTCTAIFMEDLEFDGCEIEPKKNEDGSVYKKPFDKAIESVFLNPFWGFWITSYARALLIDIITRFPKCIVQYDTDSIYYEKDHPDAPALEKFIAEYNEEIYKMNDTIFNGNPHYRDLGAWDVQKPFRRFKGLGSKRYIYEYWNDDPKKGEIGWHIKQVVAGCRKGTLEKQWKYEIECGNFDGDVFDFFEDYMTIDKSHSNKLASKFIDDYEVGDSRVPYITVDSKDYLGNTETIELSCNTLLVPVEFRMGINPIHSDFVRTLQTLYKNSDPSDEICEIYEKLLYGITRRKE